MAHDAAPSKELPEQDSDNQQPGNAGFRSYLRLFGYASSLDLSLEFIAVFAALASGVGLSMVNLLFGSFVTILENFVRGISTPESFRSEVSPLSLYLVYIGIGRLVLIYFYSSFTTIVAFRIVKRLRSDFLRSALRQEIAYYEGGFSGSISMQATSNGNLIQTGVAEKLGTVIQSFSTFISAFVLAFVTNWKLTLITASVVPAMLLIIGVLSAIDAVIETNMLKTFAQAGSFAEGILSNVRTIHAFELRSRLVSKYDEYLSQAHQLGRRKNSLYGFLFSTEYFLIFSGFALAFWRGTHMLSSGEITNTGDIFTVLLSVVVGATAITNIAPHFIFFTRAAAAAAELFQVIDRPSNMDPLSTAGTSPDKVDGDLEFKNIHFAYPTRPDVPVLQDFSLNVPAGKVTALVGASGSGKSTIIGLTERWYNTSSGHITLDGNSIDSLRLGWLRSTVRLVQQEPVLFNGTVLDNILTGLSGTQHENEPDEQKEARAIDAAKIAFADDFIEKLPNAYQTNIGQRGGLLSGGQKQRIAIARSIVSNPRVLLLDEATSALDPHAEGIVQEALNNASKNRTTITIAHKMSTIRDADNIVVMAKGKIVEQGTHEQLMELDDHYARLVKVQDLAVAQREKPDKSDSDETNNDDDNAPTEKEALSLKRTKTDLETGNTPLTQHRYNFDTHTEKRLLHVLGTIIKNTPELKYWYTVMAVCCLFAGGTFPAQAILFAELVNAFQLTGSALLSRGDLLALMFFVVALACLAIYFCLGWTSNTIAQHINHKYRKQMLDRFLTQDLEFFDREENTTGALVGRLGNYPQQVLELMGMNIALICLLVINVVACSILSLVFSWKLGLVVVFSGLPPLLLSGWAKIRLESRMESIVGKQSSNSSAIASEAVTAIRTVSSLTMESAVLFKYTRELDSALHKSTKATLVMMPLFALTQSVEYFFLALGFWYGCRLVSFGEITLYSFFVSFIGVFFAGQSAAQLFSFSTSITKGKDAANYVMWLQGLQPSITHAKDNQGVGPKRGVESIALDQVRFAYPLRPDTTVMKDTSLEVKKGQFIALVGASGCGKSTMIALLERIYDPARGQIIIDGQGLPSLDPLVYRQSVSLVQQEPVLYQGTVRENISFGTTDPTVTDAKIERACRAANAWDFVSSLPDGLHTQCGLNGSQFSGGQRQRIAIARALVRNPKVLLLDEATSALDTESERIVQQALSRTAKESNRITVAVAHRLSTVRDADAIHVFSGGRIVESGTHRELMAHGKLYPAMCQSQSVT